jgi:hypothetical protein
MKGVRVVALCDPDRKRMEKAAEELEGQKFNKYTDYRKLLEDKDIDAVSTASCNHWHAPVTIWGCEAGKDVYVEKPVCHTIWEGQQMVKAARKYDRIVQSGMQLRSDTGVAEAFQWLHEGNLGKILLSRGLCYEERSSMGKVDKPTPIPDHIDYDLWCGPSPNEPLMRRRLHFDWHWIWNTGNGDLGNQGIHQMDMCCRAIGQGKLAPRVISVGGRFGWNDDGRLYSTTINLSRSFSRLRKCPRKKGLTIDPITRESDAETLYIARADTSPAENPAADGLMTMTARKLSSSSAAAQESTSRTLSMPCAAISART